MLVPVMREKSKNGLKLWLIFHRSKKFHAKAFKEFIKLRVGSDLVVVHVEMQLDCL